MEANTQIPRQAAVAAARYTTGSVTSKDGTRIGYRQLGHGPGLVVLHGTFESAQSHMELAEALADRYTVYLPDRRGRGKSGAFGDGYGVGKEVEDLEALLTSTETHYVFGVSAGAIVCLQAARALPAIHKAAIFEPPLIINGSPSSAFLARYDQEIAAGDIPAALVTAMRGSQMGPAIFRAMPRWLLERFTKTMITGEDRVARSDDVTMSRLARTLHYDFQLAAEMEGALESFRDIRADVLLLGGSKSPSYLRASVDALARALPHARRITLYGLGHEASGNANSRGKPQLVAGELRRFFALTEQSPDEHV